MNVGDRVRLVVATDGADAGTEGHVSGRYRRNGGIEVAVALERRWVFVDEHDLEVVGDGGPDPRE